MPFLAFVLFFFGCLSSDATRSEEESSFIQRMPTGKFAYVWYVANSNPDIACATLVAASAVATNGLRSNVDLVAIYNRDVPNPERFKKLNIKLIKVEEAASKGQFQWRESFLKLRVTELFDYQRLIYFDVDTFPVGSLDNLFDIAKFPVEIAAPRAYWLPQPSVTSGGPMVIDPQRFFYERDFSKPMTTASVKGKGGEMDWINEHFRDKMDILDGFYSVLTGEWCPKDGVYQYWQKQFGEGPEWVMQNAVLVHFVSDTKPWKYKSEKMVEAKCPGHQPQFLQIYQKWWKAKAELC